MKHLALVCPSLSGHLNPMLTLGGALVDRGHRVSMIGPVDSHAQTEAAGIEFHAVATDEYPAGTMAAVAAELGELEGHAALRYTIAELTRSTSIILRDLGEVIRREKMDGLLVDQVSNAAGSVADAEAIPYVTVANALAINEDNEVPPVVVPWKYRNSSLARLRNRLAYALLNRLLAESAQTINRFRREAGLRDLVSMEDGFSSLAQIAQQPKVFDFPRSQLPETFRYTGPFHRKGRDSVEFDFDLLDGRPLVYASMGTLQNRLLPVFEQIAEACAGLDVQLVMSLGGNGAELPEGLPGKPIVVPMAPQLELVTRAAAVITHAGLNTALECLAQGVPMVAIPVTNDQPGVAARIRWLGVGEVIPLRRFTAPRLRQALQLVLKDRSYRDRATLLAQEIAEENGLERAAEIAEHAL